VANQELLALGVANVGSGLLHGFPVSSSGSRTAVAVTAGSRTQLYSVAAAASVIAVLIFARPVLARFPTAALGAIVIFAAVRLIDVTAFRRLLRFRRAELLIAVSACVGVLVFDILYGVLVAIGLSVADLLVRVARPHDAVQGLVPGLAGMGRRLVEIIPYVPIATTVRIGVSIFSYCGNVTFGVTGDYAANPDLDVLAHGIEHGISELLAAARHHHRQETARYRLRDPLTKRFVGRPDTV
jgi:sulfate permease, SulP family